MFEFSLASFHLFCIFLMEQEDKAHAEAVEEAGEEAEREEEEKEAIQRDPCQKSCPCSPFFT